MAVLSTLRTNKSIHFGFTIGILLSLMKLRKLLKKRNRDPDNKHTSMTSYRSIIKQLLLYFLKYPAFAFLLSISLRNASKHKNGNEFIYLLSKSFISSFLIHLLFPIFNTDIGLLLLCRSVHSFCKAAIPYDLQPQSIYVYMIIHSFAFCSVTIWSIYSSNKMWNLFEAAISENRLTWQYWSAHHHTAMLPSCSVWLHRDTQYRDSCWKSALYDISMSWIQAYPYFLEIHLVSTILVKGLGAIRDLEKAKAFFNFSLVKKLVTESAMTTMYFVGGSLGMTRIPCFAKWVYELFRKTKYDAVAWNNRMLQIIVGGLIGCLSLSFSYEKKRTSHAVLGLWWVLINMSRTVAKLRGNEDEKYHPVLGSKHYISFLFALSVTMMMFVIGKHPESLKGLERTVFDKYLINSS
eukprot:18143_1